MPTVRAKAAISRHRLEPLEVRRNPVLIRTVLGAARQMDGSAIQPLQGFEHRPVVLTGQPLRYMQTIVRVDADQMDIKRGVIFDVRSACSELAAVLRKPDRGSRDRKDGVSPPRYLWPAFNTLCLHSQTSE